MKLTSVAGDARVDAGRAVVVAETTIDGDLSCDAPRADGGGSSVGGSSRGACAELG
ncbi:hypothetical protein [Microbacterium sp. gxy059]|uniref:hypothetical protein n=1 Tax=Microbacterium sp. gxy059 TaxID=2957199 RepID=UPI003D95A74B